MTHPDVTIQQFTVNVVGREPEVVVVSPDKPIHFKIPESSKYTMTIRFSVQNNTLKDFKYHQTIKRAGLTVKLREMEVGPEFAPSTEENPYYEVTFPEDETPGGFLVRAQYPSTSTYYANGEELWTSEWTLEIVKK